MVRKTNGTVLRSIRRTVPIPATDLADPTPPVITLFEEFRIRPGKYLVSVVLSDPDADTPLAATRSAVVSPIPLGKPFMIGPMLGTRPGAEPADPAAVPREPYEFEPLLEQQAERGESLDSLTVVCVVKPDGPVELRALAREVTSWEGDPRQRFAPVTATLAGDGNGLECHYQYDRLETARLDPGRYELNAVAETTDFVAGSGSVEFTVLGTGTK
jgi:hypothetical protein